MKIAVIYKDHRMQNITMPIPQLGFNNGYRELDKILLVDEDFYQNENGGFSYIRRSKTRDEIDNPGMTFNVLSMDGDTEAKETVTVGSGAAIEVVTRDELDNIKTIKADGEVVWTMNDLDTLGAQLPPQPQKEKRHYSDLVAYMTSPAALESVSQSMGISSKSLPISR